MPIGSARGPELRPAKPCWVDVGTRLAFLCLVACATPARAQVGLGLSVASDDVFRGESVSEGRPTASLDLSYDDLSGAYAGTSGTIVATRNSGLQLLRVVAYGGYVRRIGRGWSLDVGIISRNYSRYYGTEYSRRQNEAYVGLVGRTISVRGFVSPDYDGRGHGSIYLDSSALIVRIDGISVDGHIGALFVPANRLPYGVSSVQADWRLGISRSIDRARLSVNWSAMLSRSHKEDRQRLALVASTAF